MQTLDVISVNIWQILISLANLTIIFLIVKKFLWKPVKKTLAKRQATLDEQYDNAQKAQESALEAQKEWDEKLKSADDEANSIIKIAADKANRRSEQIIDEAKDKANDIINRAEQEAELEKRKAQEEVKREIISVSTALTEKMLDREIKTEDHRKLIDSFIEEMGESDD